ncbi:Alkaline phosphatase [hydrothermal vent metagenome]|uniref:Alkaline phosphatase n=1 Tax=hydrothermal vent metagenome TaxID=652676 RepID=A0A3B0V244_9ZZZZ
MTHFKLQIFTLLPLILIIQVATYASDVNKNHVATETAPKIESPNWWYQQGAGKVYQLAKENPFPKKAKNIILFIGDGMSVGTVTAARILEGQQQGETGEENQLSFDKFPQTALVKTYNTNLQTADSAGTMSAIMTGVKTKAGVVAYDGGVNMGDCTSGKGRKRMTLLEIAEKQGMSTGVVTTARLTHATPAATYAHAVSRYWEADADIPEAERNKGCKDIALQLIEFPYGDGLEVAMGGGRRNFLPKTKADPEYTLFRNGKRLDKRNLMQEWKNKYADSAVIWNQKQFDAIDVKTTKHLLGLFEPSHMQYEHDRLKDIAGEPSLTAMTEKSLQILKNTKKPFFLMVESGRIDHGHHAGNAHRALIDTIEFSNAIQVALDNINLAETLVIVTADHSHVFTMSGYPSRGNPILGLVKNPDKHGNPIDTIAKDTQNKPYTTLSYANGPGYVNGDKRPDLTHVDVQSPDYKQAAAIPLISETHSGEDVVIYATGAGSQTVHGTIEQNVIYHIMKYALDN